MQPELNQFCHKKIRVIDLNSLTDYLNYKVPEMVWVNILISISLSYHRCKYFKLF